MTTVLYLPSACLGHDTGADHPESAGRLRAIRAVLEHERFAGLIRLEPPQATREQLARVHTARHIDHILGCEPGAGVAYLDADTAVSQGSAAAALAAAGAACAAVDEVLSGYARNAFCAVRPPGHHAEPDQAMGFCLFNTVAVAALHARAVHGLMRVAVADFDVHHGNGTQACFWNDPGLFYASSHQFPCWPDTGSAQDKGVADNIANAPLAPGSGSAEFRAAWADMLLPRLEAFAPELLLISAGFDAHASDPQAHLRLATADFAWITAELLGVANRRCQGKVVSVLEGGYDLRALAASAGAHVAALMTC